MKKVYVLNGGCIDDRYVVAVFSSKKRAEEERKRIINTNRFYRQSPDDLWIEEFKLNVVEGV